MADSFHSFEGTPNGISVKVGTHRTAIGVKDYATKAQFIAAVQSLLADILGDNLALIAANVAAAETDASAKIAALEKEHAAHCAELEADIATLGTKEEAQAIRKEQERAAKLAQLKALQAELMADELEATDAKP